jgi:hypothetical protein
MKYLILKNFKTLITIKKPFHFAWYTHNFILNLFLNIFNLKLVFKLIFFSSWTGRNV